MEGLAVEGGVLDGGVLDERAVDVEVVLRALENVFLQYS